MSFVKTVATSLAAIFLVFSCGACRTAFGIPYIGDASTCFMLQRELFECVAYCHKHFENPLDCTADLCNGLGDAHVAMQCPWLEHFGEDFKAKAKPKSSIEDSI